MVVVLFTPVPCILKDLIMEVENGKLGLQELQRGYVWKATKVRTSLCIIVFAFRGKILSLLLFPF